MDRWRNHFARVPFTHEILDFAQAHICQIVAASMGGKRIAMTKLLLISRSKRKQTAEQAATIFRAMTGD